MTNSQQNHGKDEHQSGTALLIVLVALLVFSVIGFYLALIATAEVRISDNFESYHRARSAALAGLNHGRALLRGIRFDDLLPGPDGAHDAGAAYVASAKKHAFRMPLSWSAARVLDIADPASAFLGVPDDGVISTGRFDAVDGMTLIPLVGIPHVAANPNGPGMIITSRYFVKVTDNSCEASELAADPADDPFVDGDGQIIMRSVGIARTLAADLHAGRHGNSVVVFEARIKRFSTFLLVAPLVVQSSSVEADSATMFSGSTFQIQGGPGAPGIAVIDTSVPDGIDPVQQLQSRLGPGQAVCIQGSGLVPSIRDITPAIVADDDKRLLLDARHVWSFVRQSVPRFADSALAGSQTWVGAAPVPLGSYEPALSSAAPEQNPRVTYVDGDVSIDGSVEGGGLLVITGRTTIRGLFKFNGLILVLGAGEIDIGGWCTVNGAILLARLTDVGGSPAWGTAKLSIGDNCLLRYDRAAVQAAVNLIPPVQLGCREITPIIDP